MPTRSAMLTGSLYYVWEVPDKLVSVQLRFEVIDRMSPEILRGLGALKRRGVEVGGILLGRSESREEQRVIIEDFEPVPTEYLTGPSYNLSANDLVTFEATIERRLSLSDDGLSVVGFYRSHTRDELFMDNADLALATRYFPDPGNVFLLVKPFATRTSIGGFFFWEDGQINRESTYLQFPFHRAELGGGDARPVSITPQPAPITPKPVTMTMRQEPERPLPVRQKPEPPLALRQEPERPLPPYTPASELKRPAPVEFVEAPAWSGARNSGLSILSAPPEPPARSTGRRLLLVPVFLAVAGVAGYLVYQNLSNSKPSTSTSTATATAPIVFESILPLKLSVAERQDQLDVNWDRRSPVIMEASRGVLSISDSTNRRDLELSGAQLRNGRVLYSRLSADVGLRLEVFRDGKESVVESIRIVSPDASGSTPLPPQPESVAERAARETPRQAALPPASSVPAKRAPRTKAPVQPPVPAAPEPEAPPPEVELQRPARRR